MLDCYTSNSQPYNCSDYFWKDNLEVLNLVLTSEYPGPETGKPGSCQKTRTLEKLNQATNRPEL
jgi:hypothetical protein